jgi:hypothetical protein
VEEVVEEAVEEVVEEAVEVVEEAVEAAGGETFYIAISVADLMLYTKLGGEY